MSNPTAGKGDPYWYEWTVGQQRVVEMLHPESGIQSVSFQVTGVKGWDDVVVKYSDGRIEFIQVKHTRAGNNITFGDLVSVDEDGDSLLNSLFSAWKELKLKNPNSEFVLYTNRAAGTRFSKTKSGKSRPPLFDFMNWLHAELPKANELKELICPPDWSDAWDEWLAQLKPGTSDDQFSFIKDFTIQANRDDLNDLETELLNKLCEIFQIPKSRAIPLFHALDNALRRWSTSHETVTIEDAYSAMAFSEEVEIEHRAPPPPAPFFPSRERTLSTIEQSVQETAATSIIFLSAEPGSGKTSLISQIVNRRVNNSLEGVIGLRYFAFRPITPSSPLIPPDADKLICPIRLWGNLLSQLREGLKGRLYKFKVPLRNDLLDWRQMRDHVLRISDELGEDRVSPFVISIDGIDHAARAMRFIGKDASDFFKSLPSPDELKDKNVRILLAGQPAASYPEYPFWLRNGHPGVKVLGISNLEINDIQILLRDSRSESLFPIKQEGSAAKLITEHTSGNTLAVVFAVNETKGCESVEKLDDLLNERNIGAGLQEYYNSIWNTAISRIKNPPIRLDVVLATAISLSRERLNKYIMASAFQSLGLSTEQWSLLLASLGPLIIEENDGYRVLHNDVRVFLHGLLTSFQTTMRQECVWMFAKHYMQPESNRIVAHYSLLQLLVDSGRVSEWANIFNVDWVFEAAALGIPYSHISDDCAEALRQGLSQKNWAVMHELACATETLSRWKDVGEIGDETVFNEPFAESPPSLNTELFVVPFSDWMLSDLRALVDDVDLLLNCNEPERATALVERWLAELSIKDLCNCIDELEDYWSAQNNQKSRLVREGIPVFKKLGQICRSVNFQFMDTNFEKGYEEDANYWFEEGWVEASCNIGPFDSANNCFCNRNLRYINSLEIALKRLANEDRWVVVNNLLSYLKDKRDRLGLRFNNQAVWWAIKSNAVKNDPIWLDVISPGKIKLDKRNDEIPADALSLCRSIAWINSSKEPYLIANQVFEAYRYNSQQENAYRHRLLFFRIAATLGRVESVFNRRGTDSASAILTPSEGAKLAKALWEYNFPGPTASIDRDLAGLLLSELVKCCMNLGVAHRKKLRETAQPFIDAFLVDQRFESLWEILRLEGDRQKMRQWVSHWLRPDGELWSIDAGNRNSIFDKLFPHAIYLDEHKLVTEAQERLRWLQITYRSHKEYSLHKPIDWLRELTKLDHSVWRDLGIKLWRISEACSKYGGDNRLSSELDTILGTSAWSCGPNDLWQLFTCEYPDCGTTQWFYPASNRIIKGLVEHLNDGSELSTSDKISSWCMAVGLSRWFDGEDHARLSSLKKTLIETACDIVEEKTLRDSIRNLTYSEDLRGSESETSGESSSEESPDNASFRTWIKRIDNGKDILPKYAIRLLKEASKTPELEFDNIARKILGAVGVDGPQSWDHYSGSSYEDICEIIRLVSSDQLWELVGAAIKYTDDSDYWTHGVSNNLNLILLANACAHGKDHVRNGLIRLIEMHERWAIGGDRSLVLPTIALDSTEVIRNFNSLAVKILCFLLSSRSAEVVQSALLGIHALVNHDPLLVSEFIELSGNDNWKKLWILNAAEVWATLFPGELETSRPILEEWLKIDPLHLRLQIWIILKRLNRYAGIDDPGFPNPPWNDDVEESSIFQPMQEIFHSPPEQHGSFRSLNRYSSAESTMKRIESCTGADLQIIRNEISNLLMNDRAQALTPTEWSQAIVCRGDMNLNRENIQPILDIAFDKHLGRNPVPSHFQVPFSRAYLSNEDPWVIRFSPVPDDNLEVWPKEDELRGAIDDPAELQALHQKMLSLATNHKVSPEEIVIAAKVQVFTWEDDFILNAWQEGVSSQEVSPTQCLSTFCGRTFVFIHDDWLEPHQPGRSPIAFVVGGQQNLWNCFPEFLPSKRWINEFGWQPSDANPLIWHYRDEVVARYENIHGPVRRARSGHFRQPLLSRWIAKKSVFDEIQNRFGPFRMINDFNCYKCDLER